MKQQEAEPEQKAGTEKAPLTSKKVTDHLANERTFLAWIRTGLATITFGFVVARFGLLLRQLGVKTQLPLHYSTIIGVALTVLGTLMMGIAFWNYAENRRSIDKEQFRPRLGIQMILTIIACLIGILLAVYLVVAA